MSRWVRKVLVFLLVVVFCIVPSRTEVTEAAVVPQCHQTQTFEVYVSDYQSSAGAAVCVYKSAPNEPIDWPVIVPEGIDPNNYRSWSTNTDPYDHRSLYEMFNYVDTTNATRNLLEEGRNYGLDFIVVDWRDGGDYIQKNAMVLKRVIEWVNETKVGGHPNVVIGPSMGGLVGRYALAWMEQNRIRHDVSLYVSWDTPHRGANIPLGDQHWLNYMARHLNSRRSDERDALRQIRPALAQINSTAAQQMLLLHYDSRAADVRRAFQEALQGIGFPQQTRNVAITNGDGFGRGRGFSPGDRLLYWHNRGLRFRAHTETYAVGPVASQTSTNIFRVWDTEIRDDYPDQTIAISRNVPAYDSAPGGSLDLTLRIAATSLPRVLGDIECENYAHMETFIPTVSALDLGVTDLYTNVNDLERTGRLYSLTPFDRVYYPAENQMHVSVTPQNRDWIMREILAGGAVCNRVTQIPNAECRALVALWNNTDGWNWTGGAQRNWIQTTQPCYSGGNTGWFGVACANGHVTELYLAGHNLTGTMPPEITNLTQLRALHLYDNHISGAIPSRLGTLPLESLMLHSNQLSGNIPDSFRLLTRIDPARSSLDWNRLTVDRNAQDLIRVLNEKFPTWQARQQ